MIFIVTQRFTEKHRVSQRAKEDDPSTEVDGNLP
jgi:hypothetical protein